MFVFFLVALFSFAIVLMKGLPLAYGPFPPVFVVATQFVTHLVLQMAGADFGTQAMGAMAASAVVGLTACLALMAMQVEPEVRRY